MADDLVRMKREIEVMRTVQQPNIMPIIDWSNSYDWYTMPLARRVLADARESITDRELLVIVRACADALGAAHEKGYVHRDLTPNNVLQLGEEYQNRWVVSDWGLVRNPSHMQATVITAKEQPLGTLGYAAPEVWRDAHSVDERADIYSLGRIVAWCKSGIDPIPNEHLYVEGFWAEFVECTTSKHPSERPHSMSAIIEFLDELNAADGDTSSIAVHVNDFDEAVTHSVRFRLKGYSDVFVFPISNADQKRFRGYLADHDKDKLSHNFSFSSTNGRDVCINPACLEFANFLWEPGVSQRKKVEQEDTNEVIFMYFASGGPAYTLWTEDPILLYDTVLSLELGGASSRTFSMFIDEDGEDLFIRLDNLAMLNAPTDLVDEGRRQLLEGRE